MRLKFGFSLSVAQGLERLMGLVGLASLMVLTSTGPASAAGWQEKARMEEGRVLAQAASHGSDIYVAGGSGISGPKTSFDLYDTESNMWRPLPPMPAARERFGMAAVSGRIYVSGGRSKQLLDEEPEVSDALWVFDTISRDWTRKADMPSVRIDHVLVDVGDRLYVIGGTGANAGKIYVYDIVSNTWSTSSVRMPEVRKGFGVATIDSKVFLIGGVSLEGALSAQVDIFDVEAGTWTKAIALPKPRVGLAAGFIAGRLHVAGGSVPDPAQTFNAHFSWADGETSWSEHEVLPTARHSSASAVVGDRWYVIGGGAAAGFYTLFSAADAVEVYEP